MSFHKLAPERKKPAPKNPAPRRRPVGEKH